MSKPKTITKAEIVRAAEVARRERVTIEIEAGGRTIRVTPASAETFQSDYISSSARGVVL